MTTTYFRNMISGNIFGVGDQPDFPVNYYIGLSSLTPSESGGNVKEPSNSGTGYKRIAITQLSSPTNGTVTNQAELTFPKANTDWFPSGSPATHYVIFDSLTGGNLLIYGALGKPRTVESDTYLSFPVGELSISVV